jgi:hypothetical protein
MGFGFVLTIRLRHLLCGDFILLYLLFVLVVT